MENLTLTSQELRRITTAFAVVFALLLVGASLIELGLGASLSPSSVMHAASGSLSVTTVLFWAFCRWAWRFGPFPKLLRRPVIRGVWIGHLSSDYGRTETEQPLRKPIVFVVRQTYLTLSIQSLTDKQVGESKVEALLRNERTETIRLAYVFELKNEYAGTRNLVNGAGDLQLLSNNAVLHGAYWTSSPTHGTLRLRRVSAESSGVDRFEDALRKWPLGGKWEAS